MSARILKGLYHFTVYLIGFTVLIAAVTVTLIRLALPDIGIYRGEVEAWVSRFMGFPVVIRSIDATWQGWIPHLHLTDIDLLNRAGTQPITHFEAAEISIAPVATILKRQFVPKHLTVSGFDLSVARLTSGAIYVEGVNVASADSPTTDNSELAEWLFKQERIQIKNGTIEWIDTKHGQDTILLTDVSLALRSDGDRLQIEGSTSLPTVYGEKMDFAFDAFGDLLTSDWSGELYLHASNINPDNWYREFRPMNVNIAGGSADISVWSNWTKARLEALEGTLAYSDFAALLGRRSLRIEELEYQFRGTRQEDDDWQFQLQIDKLETENGSWPRTGVAVLASKSENHKLSYSASFDYIRLDDIMPFIKELNTLPENVSAALAAIDIHGELAAGDIHIKPAADLNEQLQYEFGFRDLSLRGDDRTPGLYNASGSVKGNLQSAALSFNDDSARISIPSLELDNIPFSNLNGTVRWEYRDAGWDIATDSLAIGTADFSSTIAGHISMTDGATAPFIDVLMDLRHGSLENISSYIPYKPPFRLKAWMQRAVLAGEIKSGIAVFRGLASDFPFEHETGTFKAMINASDVLLEYSRHWPAIDNLDAEVIIDGKHMQANIRQGQIFSANIVNATASIADITTRSKEVDVSGKISGATHDLNLFVAQSPLQKDPVLHRVNESLAGGDIELSLQLNVPIRIPGRRTIVNGNIHFQDAGLSSATNRLQLTGLTGDVQFTRAEAKGEKLVAQFQGQPVAVAVRGAKNDRNRPPTISISGASDEVFIIDQLIQQFPRFSTARQSLLDRISGRTDWTMELQFQTDTESGALTSTTVLDSDLQGLNIDLPAPLGKNAYTVRPTRVWQEHSLSPTATLRFSYGRILSGAFAYDNKDQKRLLGARFEFGSETPPSEVTDDLRIGGHLEQLNLSEWLLAFAPEQTSASDWTYQPTGELDLQVDRLILAGQTFENVQIKLSKSVDNQWLAELNCPVLSGTLNYSHDSIVLALDRLVIDRSNGNADTLQLSPSQMPALSMKVDHFILDGQDLGTMTLVSKKIPDGQEIETLTFSKPGLKVAGTGTWRDLDGREESRFDIELWSDNISDMLSTFGYSETAIKNGETRLNLEATWPGSPLEFALEKLTGALEMVIKKGQLLDIEPKAGRLFGLLSIQTLPRRLSLDFSDLFGKGLAFDRIEGHFQLSEGNAYTNDLHLQGPSAEVLVSGRTGLSEQDYDQIVTVTPQISGTLPIASALFGPVGIGVGAVLYIAGALFDSVNNSIDQLLQYQYTITGSWTSPIIEKFDLPSESSS